MEEGGRVKHSSHCKRNSDEMLIETDVYDSCNVSFGLHRISLSELEIDSEEQLASNKIESSKF